MFNQNQLNNLYHIKSSIKDEDFGELFIISYDNKKDKNNLYIMKRINVSSNEEKNKILEQLAKLKNIYSKYIIRIKEYFIEHLENDEIICIVIDHYDKCNNLRKIIRQNNFLDNRNIWRIFIQITLGLKSFYDNNITIDTLNPENIYIDKGYNIKLGGLGLIINYIKNKEDTVSLIFNKTNEVRQNALFYISPELLKNEKCDGKSNIWSLGCILYEMAFKSPPFGEKELKENILNINYSLPVEDEDDFTKILPKLICEKDKRLTLKELIYDSIFKKKIIESNMFLDGIKKDIKSKKLLYNILFKIIIIIF